MFAKTTHKNFSIVITEKNNKYASYITGKAVNKYVTGFDSEKEAFEAAKNLIDQLTQKT
jgi:hypothetical protein